MYAFLFDKRSLTVLSVAFVLTGALLFVAGMFAGANLRLERLAKEAKELPGKTASPEALAEIASLVTGAAAARSEPVAVTEQPPRQATRRAEPPAPAPPAQPQPAETPPPPVLVVQPPVVAAPEPAPAEPAAAEPEPTADEPFEDLDVTPPPSVLPEIDMAPEVAPPEPAPAPPAVKAVHPETVPTPRAPAPRYTVHAGVFRFGHKAKHRVAALKAAGFPAHVEPILNDKGRLFHFVLVGRYSDLSAAKDEAVRLAALPDVWKKDEVPRAILLREPASP